MPIVTAYLPAWAQPWAQFYADSCGTCKPIEDEKARFYTGFQLVSSTSRNASEVSLFADTETPEDLAEQVVGTELAGNRRQRQLCQTQFFCEQLQPG